MTSLDARADTECAVVLTAGYGSRMFPVTSVINKSLMPILNLPLIHYLLTDLVQAGVRDIVIVTSAGDDQIQRYVQGDQELKASCDARGWSEKHQVIEEARAQFDAASFTFVEQPENGLYGTAVPARLVEQIVGDRSFFYTSGDDLLWGGEPGQAFCELAAASAGLGGALQVIAVAAQHAHRYGTVQSVERDGRLILERLVEKRAAIGERPLANISRYHFTAGIFDHVRELEPDPDSGELMITDAVTTLAAAAGVGISVAAGEYFDCGSVDGWLAANNALRQAQGA